MSTRLLRIAVLYALFAIGFGIYMGVTNHFEDKSVHAHAHLVGWVSMAIMAVFYKVFPRLEASKLALAQFWLHNTGLPVMLVGLYGINHNLSFGESMISFGSILVTLAFVCFALNAFVNSGQKDWPDLQNEGQVKP